MKKINSVCIALFILWALSCNNAPKSDEAAETPAKDSATESEQVSSQKPAEKKENVITARFVQISVQEQGDARYVYQDKEGNTYRFHQGRFPYTNVLLNVTDPDPVFTRKKFEIKYGPKEEKKWNGVKGKYETIKVPVIRSLQEIKPDGSMGIPKPALTLEQLKQAKFFGAAESNWSLEFKDNEMVFTPNIGEEPVSLNYSPGYARTNRVVSPVSDNHVRVKGSSSDMYSYLAIIKKESCSDGMSENSYPYSIDLYRAGMDAQLKHLTSGCGRKTGKTAGGNQKTLQFSEINTGETIQGFQVVEHRYDPRDEWAYQLEGEATTAGEFYFHPMASMLHFKPEDEKYVKLDVKGFKQPLIGDMYFKNADEVKKALGKETMQQIKSGSRHKATITLKNFGAGGKIDGYGGGHAEFVRLEKQ